MIDSFTLSALEFQFVLLHVSEFCRSESGRSLILSQRPCPNRAEAELMRKLSGQMGILRTDYDFSLRDFPDLGVFFDKISEKELPAAEDFWAVRDVLSLAEKLHAALERNAKACPDLHYGYSFAFPRAFLADLKRCINDEGEIRDESSPGLYLVRSEIRSLHQSCLKKITAYADSYNIADYLRDDRLTVAGDRYVLPLKSNFKGRIHGIVHDQSKTGETLYFEPVFLLELNNKLEKLRETEREEIAKILAYLTQSAADEAVSVRAAWDMLCAFDMLSAKCAYGDSIHGILVPFGDRLELYSASHPLLLREAMRDASRHVQPVDLLLDPEQKVLVISGGNSGGKTVALKTLGLMAAMALSGIPVPVAPGSCMPCWESVHAFIGDEQDLGQHVSTFTGQIKHLSSIWDSLDEHSLVLLDEFGSGTDPAQGAALAQAVLDGICEKGAYAVAATHFPALKTYALTRSGVRAATVLFDDKTGKALYCIAYDQVGASLALAVAQEYGMPLQVIRKAEQYLLQGSSEFESIMGKLNDLAARREAELAELRRARQKTSEKEKLMRERFEKARAGFEEKVAEMRREIMLAMRAEKITAKEAVKRLSAAAAEASAALPSAQNSETGFNAEQLTAGMTVFYDKWNKNGTVKEVDAKRSRAKLDFGGVSLWVPASDVSHASGGTIPAGQVVKSPVFASARHCYSVDLRGKRADEALEELKRFLDDAVLSSLDSVEIIHGRGTGALRKRVHLFLKDYPGVSAYKTATEEHGGDGVTIVEFS